MSRRLPRRTVLRTAGLSLLAAASLAGCGRLPGGGSDRRVPRIAYVFLYRLGPSAPFAAAFRDGLRDLGWIDGENIAIDVIDTVGSTERLDATMAELVRRNVDVIVGSCTPEALAARKHTDAIPIVVAATGDAVKAGLVESFAHPGGNITGVSAVLLESSAKRIDLLKEAAPQVTRGAVFWNPGRPDNKPEYAVMEEAAGRLGVQLLSMECRSPEDVTQSMDAARRMRADALLNLGDNLVSNQSGRLVEFAATSRIPAIYENREFPDSGGLMSYGPNFPALHRRAAGYVDKILRGAKPADLPVEQPTTFELVINLRTARSLGLALPTSLLARADEVIQ